MRVLIVEDEPLILDMIEQAVEQAGFEIAGSAGSVSRALDLLKLDIDAAILDTNLDGRSVLPVAEKLVARKIPFIVISGYLRTQLHPLLAGAPFLGKPFSADAFGAALCQMLEVAQS